jgi:S-DNA-T family DNA segregation ATPase FtsK/SpoIIIE
MSTIDKSKMARNLTMLTAGAIAIGEMSVGFGMPWGSYLFAKKLAVGAVGKIGATGVFGGILTTGALGGAVYIRHKNKPETIDRARLTSVFEEGRIYKEYGEKRIYPKIHGISYQTDRVEMTFSIPFGLHYDAVTNAEWLFKQMWTEYIDIKRAGNRFTVRAFFEPIKPFNYDYNEIRDLLKDHKFPIYVGKGRDGHVVYDATGNANGLIAGINGSGKSAFLRTMICTWLQHFTPQDMHLYLCDPKRSEFGIYRKARHVKGVCNTADELREYVREIKAELDRRSEILDREGENHILDVKTDEKFPIIVLMIDELASLDIKHRDNKDLAQDLNVISSQGRALCIQVFYSTQRPDAETITSVVKANLNTRFAFRQNSTINSNVALDSDEAAYIDINAKGLMAFSFAGIEYVQAAWLDNNKAKAIVKQTIEQYGENKAAKTFVVENGEIIDEDTSLDEFNVFGVA